MNRDSATDERSLLAAERASEALARVELSSRRSDARAAHGEDPAPALEARAPRAYRPEIDGLRALAVLPVILFHAGVRGFSGGYVGVDVFFVISGYLITTIVAAERAAGRFSLVRFYERRARRIAPALFLVMAVCLPFAWYRMLPQQLKSFSQSIAAVPLFASNILFWLGGGYFDVASEEQPLLHTWSLGVEEQYYLVFPLLVAYLWKFGRPRLLGVITGIALVSFAYSDWASGGRDPTANFFLAHSRAWELLAGSLLAILSMEAWFQSMLERLPRASLAALGFFAIIAAIELYDAQTPFPGRYALLPVLGTTLVLAFARPDNWVGRLLSLRWVVGVGLVSYSAYLWHQPMFAFARIISRNSLPTWAFGLLSCASLALAYLSWRFVERPFRDPRKVTRPMIFRATLVGSCCFIALGAVGQRAAGFPNRWGAENRELIQPHRARIGACPKTADSVSECRLGAKGVAPSIVLLGDSHVEMFADALGEALAQTARAAIIVRAEDCNPIPGLYERGRITDSKDLERCRRANEHVLAAVDRPGIDTVMVAMRWTMQLYPIAGHIDELQYDNGEGGIENDLRYRESTALDERGRPARDSETKIARLRSFLERIAAHKKLALIYPVPEVGWYLPKLNLLGIIDHQRAPDAVSTSAPRFRERNAYATGILDSVVGVDVRRVKPASVLCDTWIKDRCVVQWQRKPLYFDDDHLSDAGAALVLPQLLRAL